MDGPYTRNDVGQKCEINCGLWVLNHLNEINSKKYPKNLKFKIILIGSMPLL